MGEGSIRLEDTGSTANTKRRIRVQCVCVCLCVCARAQVLFGSTDRNKLSCDVVKALYDGQVQRRNAVIGLTVDMGGMAEQHVDKLPVPLLCLQVSSSGFVFRFRA